MKSKTFFEKKSYIKTFELKTNINDLFGSKQDQVKRFWLVKTDGDIKQALKDLGMTKKYIKYWTDGIDYINNDKYGCRYFCYDSVAPSFPNLWSWMPYSKYSIKYFKKRKYEYMGEIGFTPEELEILKIREDADKYNL